MGGNFSLKSKAYWLYGKYTAAPHPSRSKIH